MLGSLMESEIREQPALLAANVRRYRQELSAISRMELDAVVLVARGSSDNAALYARYLIEIHVGIPVALAAPSVWTRYGGAVRYPRSLVVGISQSGEAPDVSEVLDALRQKGHATLGITNTAGSRVTRVADATLELGVGQEHSVAATKTYTSSLLALYELARALGARLPEPLLPDEDWCSRANIAALEHAQEIGQAALTFALGRGYTFSSAQEAALKLMECALVACKPFSLADFEHGPKALATEGTCAVVFGESPKTLGDRGCTVITAPEPPAPAEVRPIWDAFYAQWLALGVARSKGLDADVPPGLKKVTKTF